LDNIRLEKARYTREKGTPPEKFFLCIMRASWLAFRAGPHVSWLGRTVHPACPFLSRSAIGVKLRTITSTTSSPPHHEKPPNNDGEASKDKKKGAESGPGAVGGFANRRKWREKDERDNAFEKTWQETLVDNLIAQFGTLLLATIGVSLIFLLGRERGEHRQYKRIMELRLQEVQHTLQQQQAQIRRIIGTKKHELEAIDPTAESEEIKKQVNQLLATLVSEADITAGPTSSGAAEKRGNA